MFSEVLNQYIDLDQTEDELVTDFFKRKIKNIQKAADDKTIKDGYRKNLHHDAEKYRQTEEYKTAYAQNLDRTGYRRLTGCTYSVWPQQKMPRLIKPDAERP